MKIAVTGATGFLGGYICRRLKEDGHDLRVTARKTSDTSLVEELGCEVVAWDLGDEAADQRLVKDCECVIHAAVDYRACRADQLANFTRNVVGSLRLLELARVEGAQFVFISTGAVHDKILDDRALDEAHPLWPGSTYGAYKAAVEKFLSAYKTQFDVNGSAFRPTSIYGVHLTKLEASHWYSLVRDVVDGTDVDTAAGGKVVHVEDVAEAVARAVGNADVAGESFELTDCHVYNAQVAAFAKEAAGSLSDIAKHPQPGPKHYIVVDKVGKVLGVKLNRGHEGVRKYVEALVEAMS